MKWTSYLNTQGFVVITNVITPSAKEEAVDAFLQEFGADDHTGFMDNRNFPYSRFAWMCRSYPEVLRIYQTLYGLSSPTELITAIDRGSAVSNTPNTDTDDSWLHVDYPLKDGGIFIHQESVPVYQSFISLMEPSGPGLRVVPMSDEELQHHHPRILDAAQGDTTFWMLSETHQNELRPRMVSVISPAGSVTLWKCGLVHDNTTVVHRQTDEPLARLVVYLCYVPKYWATEDEIAKRQKAFRLQHTTTHWPAIHFGLHYAGMRKKTQLTDQTRILEEFPIIQSLVPLTK